jgi:hypothetical protein
MILAPSTCSSLTTFFKLKPVASKMTTMTRIELARERRVSNEDKLTELFNQCHAEENCHASTQEVEVFVVGEGAHDRVDQSYSEEGKSKNNC